jgi:hypothetical protein
MLLLVAGVQIGVVGLAVLDSSSKGRGRKDSAGQF